MKKFAVIGMRLALPAIVVAMGITLLFDLADPDLIADPELIPRRFVSLELSDMSRSIVGAVQIVAGLCLLLPRAPMIGAALLAVLTVFVVGISIGRSSGDGNLHLGSVTNAPQTCAAASRAPVAARPDCRCIPPGHFCAAPSSLPA
jgi:uncharacterized membrane protein YphA (DoxX/SURF4 family)